MKAEDLLLTHEEYRDAIIQGGKITTGVRDYNVAATLCQRQAAKVLSWLIADREKRGLNWYFGRYLQEIIEETGLTWPPIEDFGTYGGVETLPPKEG